MFLFIIILLSVLSVLQNGCLGDETPVENFVGHLQATTHSNKSYEVKFGYLLDQFPKLMLEINNACYTINGLIGVHNETAFNVSRTLVGVMEEFYGARKKRSTHGVNKTNTNFFKTWTNWIKHTEGPFSILNSKTMDFLKTNLSVNASKVLLETCEEKSCSPTGIYKTMHQLVCSSITRSSIQQKNSNYNVTMTEFFHKYPKVLENITQKYSNKTITTTPKGKADSNGIILLNILLFVIVSLFLI
ncbi:hypothetical protein Ddc_09379 [Ditylenchus destructor]|nr:hypothetical protein Ddc_09379 [Ditylenchus destructor]